MMTRFSPILIASVVTTSACAGSSGVTFERNDAVPIPAGATVTFDGSASEGGTRVDPAVANDSVHHMIQRAIVTQLRQQGYTIVDSGQAATFDVRYFLRLQSTSGLAPTAGGVAGPNVGGGRGYGYGYGYRDTTIVSTRATTSNVSFEVDLVDERAGRTAWRGMYTGEPKSNAPSAERINSLVAEIFKTLPKVP
jgi:hypothetical protein